MNFYFLVEDRRAGKQVYSSWVKQCFLQLSEVGDVVGISENHFFILAGMGYPHYLKRIVSAAEDIAVNGHIDHFFICIDSEDMGVDDKRSEIAAVLQSCAITTPTHVVIHDCCIETWFLGHRTMLKARPTHPELKLWKRQYDTRILDPEGMDSQVNDLTRAQFHYAYLRAMFSEHAGCIYSKNNPGPVVEAHYLSALVERYQETGHIKSFGALVQIWERLNAVFP